MINANETQLVENRPSIRQTVSSIARAVARNDGPAIIAGLLEWINHPNPGVPRDALAGFILGIQKEDWSKARHVFHNCLFIAETGKFLIMGRHIRSRGDRSVTGIVMIYGDVREGLPNEPVRGVEDSITAYVGPQFEPISPVFPILIGVEAGHAFCTQSCINADSWPELDFPGGGPKLINLIEMERQREELIQPSIGDIFHKPSTKYLLEPVNRSDVNRQQLREYQFQEAGCSTGWGRGRKQRENLLPTLWLQGVENFRANAIGIDLASRLLSEEEFSVFLRCHWMRVFGWDAHVHVRTHSNPVAIGALLEFSLLFENGFFTIEKDKLALRRMSDAGLSQAALSMRAAAVDLTRKELSTDPGILPAVYGSIHVTRSAEALFEKYVRDPCRERFAVGGMTID